MRILDAASRGNWSGVLLSDKVRILLSLAALELINFSVDLQLIRRPRLLAVAFALTSIRLAGLRHLIRSFLPVWLRRLSHARDCLKSTCTLLHRSADPCAIQSLVEECTTVSQSVFAFAQTMRSFDSRQAFIRQISASLDAYWSEYRTHGILPGVPLRVAVATLTRISADNRHDVIKRIAFELWHRGDDFTRVSRNAISLSNSIEAAREAYVYYGAAHLVLSEIVDTISAEKTELQRDLQILEELSVSAYEICATPYNKLIDQPFAVGIHRLMRGSPIWVLDEEPKWPELLEGIVQAAASNPFYPVILAQKWPAAISRMLPDNQLRGVPNIPLVYRSALEVGKVRSRMPAIMKATALECFADTPVVHAAYLLHKRWRLKSSGRSPDDEG